MKKDKNTYQLAKYACYTTNISMAVVATLSPLLFVTFRRMYGISYTLLGLLVAVNFSTQLLIDLIFTFFEKKFNIHKTVRLMPFLTFAGLWIYAILPHIYPHMAYMWIVLGTVIFSVSSGLNEVLASPVVAAIPSDNPEREMSKLHSSYAWGVVGVVIISTIFIKTFGAHNWCYLAIFWSALPFASFLMFQRATLPNITTSDETAKNKHSSGIGLFLCFCCIFLGGAAECTMTQWASGFIESAIGIPKLWGDIIGVAVFAALLGCGRTLYASRGKDIVKVMLWGMAGAAICYLAAGLSMNPVISLTACIVTGFCVSMLWPGTIICVEEKIPGAGVAAYALMAAGGDMGASVAPQLVGILSDKIALTDFALELSKSLHITTEQIGMRFGIIISSLFPILGIALVLCLKKYFAIIENK